MRNVELSTVCLVLFSACVDFHKVKRGLPVKKSIAIEGGGRPTRLLPHAKMLLIPKRGLPVKKSIVPT